jgi:NADPH-dependent ferric siderophore reductase
MTMQVTSPHQRVAPRIERVRHELKRRSLQVEEIRRVTPGLLRITFGGADLADFVSLAPDDHIKIFVTGADGESERRDYTPRRYDPAARTLAIEFALHDAGPATAWALAARIGDTLDVAGPRGSAVVSPDVRTWVLIGDETALPAIGRRIEEADSAARITGLGAITGPGERQTFETRAALTMTWAYRPLSMASDPAPLLDQLKAIDLLPDTFVWIAAEANVARTLKAYLLAERGFDPSWIKAAGYWVMGEADAHEKLE